MAITIGNGVTVQNGIRIGNFKLGPTTIGQAYAGGYYAGKVQDAGTEYYLIVAPKSTETELALKTSNTGTVGTSSEIDGPTNTEAMNNSSHPAAQYCRSLTTGGFTDWYLPAKNEYITAYYFLKPTTETNDTGGGANPNAVAPEPINTNFTSGNPAQTSVPIFRVGGSEAFGAEIYWSSTQWADNAGFNWAPNFFAGQPDVDSKVNPQRVRAARRISVNGPEVNTPQNTLPANAQGDIVQSTTLVASSYSSPHGYAQGSSAWQVATDSGFTTLVVDTGAISPTNSYSIARGVLTTGTTYYWRVRYGATNGILSDWSTPTTFTTAASFVPSGIGAAFAGGYYAGKINQSGTEYYLVVAPKSTETELALKTSNTGDIGASSEVDGPSNTVATNDSNHPAAQYCSNLSFGGYNDWYLPAKNEYITAYYFLKPTTETNDTGGGANPNAVAPEPINTNFTSGNPAQTSVPIFRVGGSEAFGAEIYWSSTEFSDPRFNWAPNFFAGQPTADFKVNPQKVRAARRVPV